MKAAIISHGQIRNFEFIRNLMYDCDLLICADGGGEYVLKCGLIPDVLIGDLDSIDNKTLEKIKQTKCSIIKYPTEKDYTDTELAVDYAIEHGAIEIMLIGCFGDRLDHSLANIFLLKKLLDNKIKAYMIDEKNTIYIIDDEINLTGKIGDILSLIPVSVDVTGINTKGLKYELVNSTILFGDPIGISNVFTCSNVEITIKSGWMLIIKSRD